ncbi:MAG: circularly permuted type 2 ATP-grasp protein [Kineosporiaceae bacterium]|nr:circularly permuted type 2 ATP-grasp protein [Kineosporiaceae bacterium]
MAELFEGYGHVPAKARAVAPRAWDEMLSVTSRPRKPYRAVHATLRSLDSGDLVERADALARTYLDQGVTFDFAGEERPFPLDVVPRVISAEEWQTVETGVAQRVRVLEAFLADVYGPREVIKAKIIPWRVIASASGFHRLAAGLRPANGVRIHVAGIDLIRDQDGAFRVLEDNVRVPSGVSYVMANRRVMATVFPESFATHRIRPVDEYPNRLLAALRAAAPDKSREPTVVVLTPGIYNSAYFEHTLLARTMGVELVEGRDLYCSGGRVFMRTTDGQQQVDVIYRRVDDDFLDPVQFRADSMLGTPGLVNAVRAGNVAVANAIGNGVADDKLIYTYVPDLCRFYLGEEVILPNVQTYRLSEPADLAEVLGRLDELVLKPVDGAGGKGLVIGPDATREQLATLRAQIEHDPRGWIAQPVVQLSTVPTLIDGVLRPRHVDLRPFAVNDGRSVWVLPGGLTRVALPEGQLVVNSSQGGGSKDTWVLSGARAVVARRPSTTPYRIVALPHPDPGPQDDGAGLQQQQQQQQQQQEHREEHQLRGEPSC